MNEFFFMIAGFNPQDLIRLQVRKRNLSLVGRLMTIKSNNAIKCLSYPEMGRNGEARCSHFDLVGCEMVILSEKPYDVKVIMAGEPTIEKMVRVISLDTGLEYEVLFNEAWLRKESK